MYRLGSCTHPLQPVASPCQVLLSFHTLRYNDIARIFLFTFRNLRGNGEYSPGHSTSLFFPLSSTPSTFLSRMFASSPLSLWSSYFCAPRAFHARGRCNFIEIQAGFISPETALLAFPYLCVSLIHPSYLPAILLIYRVARPAIMSPCLEETKIIKQGAIRMQEPCHTYSALLGRIPRHRWRRENSYFDKPALSTPRPLHFIYFCFDFSSLFAASRAIEGCRRISAPEGVRC